MKEHARTSLESTPHGTTNKNMKLTDHLIARMDEIHRRKLDRNPGSDQRQCAWYQEMIERGLKYTDPATGLEKAPSTTTSLGISTLPIFDPTGFATDAELVHAMDASHQSLWFGGPDGSNIHVSSWLEYCTGWNASKFRDAGWLDVIHPDNREQLLEIGRQGRRIRQPYSANYGLRHANGAYHQVFDYTQPYFRPDGSFAGFVGTIYYLPPGASMVFLPEPVSQGRILSVIPPAGPGPDTAKKFPSLGPELSDARAKELAMLSNTLALFSR